MHYLNRERLLEAADRLLLNRFLNALPVPEGWSILYAHGISDGPPRLPSFDDRFVELATFRAELEHLKSSGYDFISLSEGISRLREGKVLKKVVTLTFDDGLRTVIELAYPVMQELGVKGCMYIVTDTVGTSRLMWTDAVIIVCWYRRGAEPLIVEFPDHIETFSLKDECSILQSAREIVGRLRAIPDVLRRQVFQQFEDAFSNIPEEFVPREYRQTTWEQLESTDPEIMEIGNHTVSHPNLTAVDDRHLRSEVFDAKIMIERKLGRPVKHFCYPGGMYDKRVIECVRSSGHASATGDFGRNWPGTSLFELRRLGLDSSLPRFKARMSGLEYLLSAARRLTRLVPVERKLQLL